MLDLSESLDECIIRIIDFVALDFALFLTTSAVLTYQFRTRFALIRMA